MWKDSKTGNVPFSCVTNPFEYLMCTDLQVTKLHVGTNESLFVSYQLCFFFLRGAYEIEIYRWEEMPVFFPLTITVFVEAEEDFFLEISCGPTWQPKVIQKFKTSCEPILCHAWIIELHAC